VLIREWRGVSHRVTVLDREQETGAVVLSRRESSQRRDGMIVMHRIFQPSLTGPLDFEATIEWTTPNSNAKLIAHSFSAPTRTDCG
jgi:hypothetical protein